MLNIAYDNCYSHPLPANHRFPMQKYNLLAEQLVYEGTIKEHQLFAPPPLPDSAIVRIHQPEYWNRLHSQQLTRKEEKATGFPHSPELIDRETRIMNGTVIAADFALKHGVAMNIAGGTHHAFTNRGEGFCLLNDLALAADHVLESGAATKILIVDLDVHQGNGTAEIFANEPRVFTFSMHGAHNYPLRKETSDLDIPLPDGTSGTQYLKILSETLPKLIDEVEPEFVLYQSGVDVLETDKLGRLALSIEDCKQRDQAVLSLCKSNDLPVVASMGGGYSHEIRHIVEAHANTFRLAQEIFF